MQEAPEFITIRDNKYKVADLPKEAIEIANDIQLIQNEVSKAQIQINICNLAAEALVEKLVAATADLEVVTEEVQA